VNTDYFLIKMFLNVSFVSQNGRFKKKIMFVEFFNIMVYYLMVNTVEKQNFGRKMSFKFPTSSHATGQMEAWLMKFIFLCGIVLGGMIASPYIAIRRYGLVIPLHLDSTQLQSAKIQLTHNLGAFPQMCCCSPSAC